MAWRAGRRIKATTLAHFIASKRAGGTLLSQCEGVPP
eukprot:CAMPEP_0178419762 /NCGR_PEP_ID=MMETSP0689_2-20121128/25778_1 /TAXON_ID=160604 /ORGANISM="Amphidinium massartii, Strain CS-259" /LENGTH=36 /DNA_ID= /DNA_START= /DNA_END= /DNA_ORIENTATION=